MSYPIFVILVFLEPRHSASCGIVLDNWNEYQVIGGKMANGTKFTSNLGWEGDINAFQSNGGWHPETLEPEYAVPYLLMRPKFEQWLPYSHSETKPYTGTDNWLFYNTEQNRFQKYTNNDQHTLNLPRVRNMRGNPKQYISLDPYNCA